MKTGERKTPLSNALRGFGLLMASIPKPELFHCCDLLARWILAADSFVRLAPEGTAREVLYGHLWATMKGTDSAKLPGHVLARAGREFVSMYAAEKNPPPPLGVGSGDPLAALWQTGVLAYETMRFLKQRPDLALSADLRDMVAIIAGIALERCPHTGMGTTYFVLGAENMSPLDFSVEELAKRAAEAYKRAQGLL